MKSSLVVSDSFWPHELSSPWNSPGRNTGLDSLSFLQRIFPTQGSNPDLLHSRQINTNCGISEASVKKKNIYIYIFYNTYIYHIYVYICICALYIFVYMYYMQIFVLYKNIYILYILCITHYTYYVYIHIHITYILCILHTGVCIIQIHIYTNI